MTSRRNIHTAAAIGYTYIKKSEGEAHFAIFAWPTQFKEASQKSCTGLPHCFCFYKALIIYDVLYVFNKSEYESEETLCRIKFIMATWFISVPYCG